MKAAIVTTRADPALSARISSVRALPGVRAGSGLLRTGAGLLAIQDDAQAAVWIDPISLGLETLVLEGSGAALPKPQKPDYEALLQAPDGSLYLLGSGSRPNRCRIACLRRSARGRSPTVELRDATPLYRALADELGRPPNIEAALFVAGGSRLRLFHRGAADERDAWLDFEPAVLTAGAAPQLLDLTRFELGQLGGVPLHFTDAALLASGDILYVAVAENTPDAIADGPVAGAAIGVLGSDDGSLRGRWAPIREHDGSVSLRKAEGVALNRGERDGYLITDPDDPMRAAELCGFELTGPWV